MPAKLPRDLTDKEEKYVANVIEGMSRTEAAREAGYSDPGGEVDRLRARVELEDAIVKGLQRAKVNNEITFNRLRKKMMVAFDDVLDRATQEVVEDSKGRTKVVTKGPRYADRAKAAKDVADILFKLDGAKSLADKAREEDESTSRKKLADSILEGETHQEPSPDSVPAPAPPTDSPVS